MTAMRAAEPGTDTGDPHPAAQAGNAGAPKLETSSGATGYVVRRFRPAIPRPYGLPFPVWRTRSSTVARFAGVVAAAGRRQVATLHRRLGRSTAA